MTNHLSAIRSGAELLALAEKAQRENDRRTAMAAAKLLQRRGLATEAWRIFSQLRADKWMRPEIAPAWNGEPLDGKTLLVADPVRNIGPIMRMARFLEPAAAQARRVLAYTDPRLVNLLSRTFPSVDVRANDDRSPMGPVDFVASYDRLGQYLTSDDETALHRFRRLVPDDGIIDRITQRSKSDRPRIGIAWGSSNPDKSMPSRDDWIRFMEGVDADFVSLQYREEEYGVDDLQRRMDGKLTRVAGVDHFNDIDAHCAAIASTDLVVMISNTTAEAAGCLGHPFAVLFDEQDGNIHWSENGESDWFFPSAHLLRRDGQEWSTVFERAATWIARMAPENLHGVGRNE